MNLGDKGSAGLELWIVDWLHGGLQMEAGWMSAVLESFRYFRLKVAFVGSAGCCPASAQKVACSGVWSVSFFWLTVAFIGIWLGWLAFGAWSVASLACAGWLHRCRLCGLRWPWTAVESLDMQMAAAA